MTKPPKTRPGLRALQQKVEAKGLAALDRRYAGARALHRWRSELIEALGGEEQLSPQQITLIEQVTRLKLFLDHVDSWLMVQPSLINKRKKAILPAMQQRLQLASLHTNLEAQFPPSMAAFPQRSLVFLASHPGVS